MILLLTLKYGYINTFHIFEYSNALMVFGKQTLRVLSNRKKKRLVQHFSLIYESNCSREMYVKIIP
jgi:hypothetical protein